jgi:hypothetical protein
MGIFGSIFGNHPRRQRAPFALSFLKLKLFLVDASTISTTDRK